MNFRDFLCVVKGLIIFIMYLDRFVEQVCFEKEYFEKKVTVFLKALMTIMCFTRSAYSKSRLQARRGVFKAALDVWCVHSVSCSSYRLSFTR